MNILNRAVYNLMNLGFMKVVRLKLNYHDLDGNELLFIQGSHPKSKKELILDSIFKNMKKIIESLLIEFSCLRMDLFNCEGKIYFGEMTFYPVKGLQKYNSLDEMLIGKYIPVMNIDRGFLV